MYWPPCVPSLSGWIMAVTFMPGVRVPATQPCWAKPPGAPSSIAHCSGRPAAFGTIIWIQLCGLVHWNSLIVPSRTIFLSTSNMAKEWCAKAGIADIATAMPANPSALQFIASPCRRANARRLRPTRHRSTRPNNPTKATVQSLLVCARIGVCRAIRVALHRSVRKRDRHVLAAMRAVLERMDHGRDLHARGQGLGNPALPRQTARRAKLDGPLLVVDGHQDPAMRVGPLEFLDGPFQRHLLVGVEHREGMMREGRDRIHGNRDSRETKGFELHLAPPDWLPSASDRLRLGISDEAPSH